MPEFPIERDQFSVMCNIEMAVAEPNVIAFDGKNRFFIDHCYRAFEMWKKLGWQSNTERNVIEVID